MSDQFEPETSIEAAAPPSLGERFSDVFVAPRRAMAAVAERPAWGIPLLVIFTLMVVYTMATMHITVPEQSELMLSVYPAEMQDKMLDDIDEARDPTMFKRVLQGLQAGFGVILFAIMIPAFAHHLFSRLSDGKGKLGQTFGVVFWAALVVFGLKTLLSWIVVAVTGTGRWAGLSLQSLLPDQNPLNPLNVLAGFWGDPFFYWTLWLVIIGLATVHRFSLTKAAIVVGAVHVLFSGLVFGIVLVAQMVFRSMGA